MEDDPLFDLLLENREDPKINSLKKDSSDIRVSFPEERRLFYVAMTRCKKKVYICYQKDKESSFL